MRAYERLIRYTAYPTGSDPKCETTPSCHAQWDFARDLETEMRDLGFTDIDLDEHCYLMGEIPANISDYKGPIMGLIAHIDVSCEAPFNDVKPHIVHYEGGDLIQNEEKDLRVSVADFPFLENYIGCDIITSDGTTLLGADNKAGIAEILTLAERLQKDDSIKHGTIRVCFTPDEEIGMSSEFFDVKKFGADAAYTVDGDAFGECQSETFNAIEVNVVITGLNIHPGSAKNKMINASRIAAEFERMIPDAETPEHTEMYEGFYHLCSMSGDVEKAQMEYIIRDHDLAVARKRGETLQKIADFLNYKYGEGTVVVELEESYRNMHEILKDHPKLVDIPLDVIREMGTEPDTSPIRGGTDGAFLSFKGLPCPNIGPGGHNFHSRKEFAVVQSMDKAVEMLVKITERFAQADKDI
ncbi:peptidase T [Aminicella lysinilytica]|uniref:Peptidase T n=1 Tax=Aminicella lysinilytica TaxID=433323 RepID=A0A4V3CS45_9FIRM|nr:peptidase T [Aminicella lysinilytica]TDP59132.1 tripeptide aminopeptidase [Aminicella lysinilytica]